jgi:hypothetical protein
MLAFDDPARALGRVDPYIVGAHAAYTRVVHQLRLGAPAELPDVKAVEVELHSSNAKHSRHIDVSICT